jgi:hypothetical protein
MMSVSSVSGRGLAALLLVATLAVAARAADGDASALLNTADGFRARADLFGLAQLRALTSPSAQDLCLVLFRFLFSFSLPLFQPRFTHYHSERSASLAK